MSSQQYYKDRWWTHQVAGFREYLVQDGTAYYTRLRNSKAEWTPYEPRDQPYQTHEEEAMRLVLVLEDQPGPKHWSFFISREGQPGTVYQVTGDHTDMRYGHIENTNLLTSETVFRSYVLAENLSDAAVQHIQDSVHQEPPPSAPSQKEVKENCQSWCIRVMRRLVEAGIIGDGWIQSATAMVEH